MAKKIVILGMPGSGKSTFATQLGLALDIPVHHLDRHVFEDGKGKKRDRKELLAILEAIAAEEAWIVEGCSISTLETRFPKADLVIYFQFSRLVCLWRILRRFFYFHESLNTSGCIRKINVGLIEYIWRFAQKKGPVIEALRKRYPHVKFLTFTSSQDAAQFLKRLKTPSHKAGRFFDG